MRLGYVLMEGGRCGEAVPHFNRAIANHFPTADAHLGLAGCQIAAKDLIAAERTLRQGDALEPDNPSSARTSGSSFLISGGLPTRFNYLQRALCLDPDLHQARFSARGGLRAGGPPRRRRGTGLRAPAAAAADAPQRPEVERLLVSRPLIPAIRHGKP